MQDPCYAYVAADKGDTVAGGADDMNHCLYQDEIDDANDVANKFGAGATFGPTLVRHSDRQPEKWNTRENCVKD